MHFELESDIFSNRNRRLNFVRLRKNRAIVSLAELGRLEVRDVNSGTRSLTFDTTNKKVAAAKLLNSVLATEKSRRKMSHNQRYRRRRQPVCGRGFDGGT